MADEADGVLFHARNDVVIFGFGMSRDCVYSLGLFFPSQIFWHSPKSASVVSSLCLFGSEGTFSVSGDFAPFSLCIGPSNSAFIKDGNSSTVFVWDCYERHWGMVKTDNYIVASTFGPSVQDCGTLGQ
ncbi:hypothetical protein DPMN_040775 [Dreissena polymorpha]|uniref:Uncharacterized protein n=1 Tax=Dreissena polymorpha TaxID=45954 RepID=A0A9D4HX90_DREPO|nr:hypothetical protein DPMN_040775 [Dreissena polymorpha]